MSYVDNALLVMLMVWYCTSRSVTLRTTFTRRPLLGYRCVLNNPASQTTLLNTARAQCVWRCLSSDDCVVVSHNHRLNSCDLSTRICDTVTSDTESSVNVYGMDRTRCFSWVPKSEYDTEKAVAFAQRPGGIQIAVARKEVNAGLYPGKLQLSNSFLIKIAMDENTLVSYDRGEILLMDSDCLWVWIPYVSPDILPIGTVAAGHDVNKEPLYVARAKFQGLHSIGYYKSSKLLGYFVARNAVDTTTKMELLVVLWWSYCFITARYNVNIVSQWRNLNIYIYIKLVTANEFYQWLILYV